MTSRTPTTDSRAWQVAVIVAYLAMVAMNALANTLPLFGRNTGEVWSDYPSLFTPAPYTFSVWGLIYLALAGCVAVLVVAGLWALVVRARQGRALAA